MFGGKLLTNNIQPLIDKNCLLAVFSNQLYVFDMTQTHILTKVQLSENIISAWKFIVNQAKIVAIDQDGQLIEAEFKDFSKKAEDWYMHTKINSKKIAKSVKDARIVLNTFNNDINLFFIQQDNLYQYIKGAKNIYCKNVDKILFTSESYLVCIEHKHSKNIKILNLEHHSSQNQITFQHHTEITAVLIAGENLIIGDLKGKVYIYKNYLKNRKINSTLATKLEWHVHRINSLFIEGEYLYSCGEEGTVVMWHLRQNNRDFLPRIGSEVNQVIVHEGLVFCLLNDNTITSIDLNNDKLLKHYKTIVNPFGYLTKSIKEKRFQGKNICFLSSNNNRNLSIIWGLAGSLQLLNLNDGSNHEIQILPRNLISRLDEYYPEPHDIFNVNFNKDWTLMCCSTYGINHNYLHFYKNQGYNLQYNLISKVENPHEGPVSILNFNNMFVTFSKNQKTLRFWSKVKKVKKSIVEKEQEYFTCSGQIIYREKLIQSCNILPQENLLIVNYGDQIVLIDLKKRQIQIAFKVKGTVETVQLIKSYKNSIHLILVTKSKIIAYELNKVGKQLKNSRTIYTFESEQRKRVQISYSTNSYLLGVLVRYTQKQLIFQYDLSKSSIINSLQNSDCSQISLLAVSYQGSKLLALSSDSTITNVSLSPQQFVHFSSKQSQLHFAPQSQQTTYIQNQSFEALNKNFIERSNVRNKAEIIECLEKMELEMYPNISFGFQALCQKMFY